jgi:hypothetical protein
MGSMDSYQKVYREIKLLLEKLPDEYEAKETLNIIYNLLQDNHHSLR